MRGRANGFDPELLTTFFWMFVLITAIIIGVAVLQRIRKVYFDPEQSDDVLETLRKALEEGELDKEEFKRVEESFANTPGPVEGSKLPPSVLRTTDADESLPSPG